MTLALAVLLARPILASAEEKVVEEREIAGWALMASKDDSNGKASCMVTRDDKLGPILGVSIQSGVDAILLVLANLTPSRMKVGSFYDVRYSIDDATPIPVAAQAKSQTTFLIAIGKTFAALDPFRAGRKIDFKAPQTIALFDLSGSAAAFDALQNCTERYIGREFSVASGGSRLAPSGDTSSGDVPAASPETPPPVASSSESLAKRIRTAPAPVIEAMLVSEILLKEAHLLRNAEMLDGSSAVKWALPKATVALVVVDEGLETSVDESLAALSENLQRACANQARIERPAQTAAGQGRLQVYCRDYPPAMFTLFNRPRGGRYLMTIRADDSPGGSAAAEQYDRQLANVLTGWPSP